MPNPERSHRVVRSSQRRRRSRKNVLDRSGSNRLQSHADSSEQGRCWLHFQMRWSRQSLQSLTCRLKDCRARVLYRDPRCLNCISMGLRRNIGAKFRNPAIEQRAALLAKPRVDDRGQIAQPINLWDKGAKTCAAPDDANDILTAEYVRLPHAERTQLGAHGRGDRASTLMLVMKMYVSAWPALTSCLTLTSSAVRSLAFNAFPASDVCLHWTVPTGGLSDPEGMRNTASCPPSCASRKISTGRLKRLRIPVNKDPERRASQWCEVPDRSRGRELDVGHAQQRRSERPRPSLRGRVE